MIVSGVAFGVFVILLAAAPTFAVAFGVTVLVGAATTGLRNSGGGQKILHHSAHCA